MSRLVHRWRRRRIEPFPFTVSRTTDGPSTGGTSHLWRSGSRRQFHPSLFVPRQFQCQTASMRGASVTGCTRQLTGSGVLRGEALRRMRLLSRSSRTRTGGLSNSCHRKGSFAQCRTVLTKVQPKEPVPRRSSLRTWSHRSWRSPAIVKCWGAPSPRCARSCPTRLPITRLPRRYLANVSNC